MRPQRRPARLADVVSLADRAGRRRRAEPDLPPALHRAVTAAAETAAPLLAALAAKGDADAILRVAEAIGEIGQGRAVRATRILDEILSSYRDAPA